MKDVLKMAKDVAKVSELKMKIIEKKTEKDRFIFKLGQSVYDNYSEINSDEIDGIVGQIKNIDAEIEAIENEIMVVKSLKKCPECGEVVDINQNFCGKCGAKLPVPEPEVQEPEPEVEAEVEEVLDEVEAEDAEDTEKTE